MIDVVAEVEAAERRLAGQVRETWVEESRVLSTEDTRVFLKLENLQHTGSFKARGALNKVRSLSPAERDRGVVTASTGNHGAAVAYSLARQGASGTVFVPVGASATKVEAVRRLGTEVRVHGDDPVATERFARRFAARQGSVYLAPYNDPQVIGGQGTVAAELLRQVPDVEAIFVPLGGGGLAGGIAGFCKGQRPEVEVIAASPENSAVMIESVRAGRLLELPSQATLSDGTAGGVEADSITFPLIRDHVDELLTVSESEIASALRQVLEGHHLLIEGSAAVAVAAFLKSRSRWHGRCVAIVLSGANIGRQDLLEVLRS